MFGSKWMFFLVLGMGMVGHVDAADRDWLYQLQDADPKAIVKTRFPLVVMDPTRHGDEGSRYTQKEIDLITNAGKLPVAYFSIGEAENYRSYWNDAWVDAQTHEPTDLAPSWLGKTNPDWPGNFKVRYWEEEWWQDVLKPELRRIVQQGFRGVYLDIIDAFEYWPDPTRHGLPKGHEQVRSGDPRRTVDAAQRMIALVMRMAKTAREMGGRDFLIIPQNGESIVDHDWGGDYLATINGIGVESVWYVKTEKQQDQGWLKQRLKRLRRIAATPGNKVLSVDYVDNGERDDPKNLQRIQDYQRLCHKEGFWCYAARDDQALDELNIIPGRQPK
ncbi:MJ1477/TM1410 family putative glycoside hydrolase [Magnetococcus sp. PR-3]|uniref:MJ1477/TM1410 family putative glycoside hydrolase n=1 Tax=Magnetococcus sp. PR-3 TaxID=3120355 RepID=UPI002FCE67C1